MATTKKNRDKIYKRRSKMVKQGMSVKDISVIEKQTHSNIYTYLINNGLDHNIRKTKDGWYSESENNLRKIRTDENLTQKELAEKLGTYGGAIMQLELGYSPITKYSKTNGNVPTDLVVKICKFFNCEIEDIFPREFCKINGKEMTEDQIKNISCGRYGYIDKKVYDLILFSKLHNIEQVLDERLFFIIKLRYFNGETLEEVGNKLCLSRARVGDLERRALYKLRYYLDTGLTKRAGHDRHTEQAIMARG